MVAFDARRQPFHSGSRRRHVDMLPFLTVALLGFLAGRHFPRLRGWIARGIARYRAVAARPPGPWRWRSRLLFVVGALAATAPVWPVVEPGDPVTNELLQPAE